MPLALCMPMMSEAIDIQTPTMHIEPTNDDSQKLLIWFCFPVSFPMEKILPSMNEVVSGHPLSVYLHFHT